MRRSSVFLAGEVAKRDLDKALSVADQIPDGSARNQWLYGTAWEIASKTPDQAALIAESLTPGGYRKRALEHIGKQWLRKDADAATQWINGSGHFDAKKIEKLLNR